jgi:hypothetical protein
VKWHLMILCAFLSFLTSCMFPIFEFIYLSLYFVSVFFFIPLLEGRYSDLFEGNISGNCLGVLS